MNKKQKTRPKNHFCPRCGTAGRPKEITKGSFAIEFILWLFFIVPGIIYGIWRLSTRYQGCPVCRAPMIPLTSPVAQAAIRDLNEKIES